MTLISATVVADSLHPQASRLKGDGRLVSILCCYPEGSVHKDVMTYRRFARNARSTRAVRGWKFRKPIWRDPAFPVFWGSDRKGMQAGAELTGWRLGAAKAVWGALAYTTLAGCALLDRLGCHKEVMNAPLVPYAHISVLITATEAAWTHFLAQRYHPDAKPELQVLARRVADALAASTPRRLTQDQWHLPMTEDVTHLPIDQRRAVSAARCANLSFFDPEGRPMAVPAALKLCDSLMARGHFSPLEHVCVPDFLDDFGHFALSSLHGCTTGWVQWRKTLPGEITDRFTRPADDFTTALLARAEGR